MFDLEREHFRKTYQLCRLAFLITAVALVLASFSPCLRCMHDSIIACTSG